jgi:hypothetical protein
MRGDNSGKMRSPTGSGNNHADAAARSSARIVRRAIRRPVRRGDVDFVTDPETLERFRGLAHDIEIGITTHHN